ncbi:uncharacterized protein LOC119650912 isoform X3 [Hermetia illucens]|uniref:uncharacterized protein LOC119650912 isoform X3 n=1 Tax=Hermetia illucens TaxID=343691 RepID=UPI0018CC6FD1|nr:uncharacterized protein LOC119650912 isoform X3 [Hermetia illucens]
MTSKRGTKLVVFKGYIEEMPITDYQYVVERKSDIVLDNEQLNFIRGQRGNYLACYLRTNISWTYSTNLWWTTVYI